MNRRIWVLAGVLGCFAVTGCDSGKPGKDDEKYLYALGQMYARKIEALKLSPHETDVVMKGFKDWTVKKTSEVDFDTQKLLLQGFIDKRVEDFALGEKDKGKTFVEKYLKGGGKSTPSGLAYKIVKPGSNKHPVEVSEVEVHYEGKLIDGKVFDSSIARKEKAKFRLNQVIRGWTEGLQLIGEGGEIELVIPSDLAYGDQGTGEIPPGATLMFTVQLFSVGK